MSGFLLDTHLWWWLQTNDPEHVTAAFTAEVEGWQRDGSLFVSAVSAWEMGMLLARGRLLFPLSLEEWIRAGTASGGFRMLELSTEILIDSTRLPGELHRDPADRMLLATAVAHDLTLVTRDKALVRYGKQGYVKVIKR